MSLKTVAVACLLAASLMAVGSSPAGPKEDCSWGASSVVVEQMNGRDVESGPVTTGCIPTAH